MEFFYLPYWLTLILIVSVGVPITVSAAITLYKDWDETYVVKRHRTLLVASIAATSLLQLGHLPWFAIDCITYGDSETIMSKTVGMKIIFVPCGYFLIFIVCLRLWLLFFNINLNKFRLQKVWRVAIDPTAEEHNWFERHQCTWGRPKYLLIGTACLVLALSGTSAALRVQDIKVVDRVVGWTSLLAATCVCGVLWYKLKTCYYDSLGMIKEHVLLLNYGIFCLIVPLVVFVLEESHVLKAYWYDISWMWILFTLCNGLLTIMVFVPRWITKRHKSKSTQGAQSATHAHANKSSTDLSERFGSNWTDIVATRFGYESLFNWTQFEFSLENLGFITEYMQVKHVLQLHLGSIMYQMIKENVQTRYHVELPMKKFNIESNANHVPVSIIARHLHTALSNLFETHKHLRTNLSLSQTAAAHFKLSSGNLSSINLSTGNISNDIIQSSDASACTQGSATTSFEVTCESEEVAGTSSPRLSAARTHSGNNSTSWPCKEIIIVTSDTGPEPINERDAARKETVRQLGMILIETFVKLHKKYVENGSDYMLNLPSRTRRKLLAMLDSVQPGLTRGLSTLLRLGSGAEQGSIEEDLADLSRAKSNASQGEKQVSNASDKSDAMKSKIVCDHDMQWSNTKIRKELEDYLREMNDISEGTAILWLLNKLVENMERAVEDVSKLLNDSYVRFQSDSESFEKCVELAKKKNEEERVSGDKSPLPKSLFSLSSV